MTLALKYGRPNISPQQPVAVSKNEVHGTTCPENPHTYHPWVYSLRVRANRRSIRSDEDQSDIRTWKRPSEVFNSRRCVQKSSETHVQARASQ